MQNLVTDWTQWKTEGLTVSCKSESRSDHDLVGLCLHAHLLCSVQTCEAVHEH